jgi:hypothetical protein
VPSLPWKLKRRIVRQSFDTNHECLARTGGELHFEVGRVQRDRAIAQTGGRCLMLTVRAHLHDQPARRCAARINERQRHAAGLDSFDDRGNVLAEAGATTVGVEKPHLAPQHVSRAVQIGRAEREVGERLERDGARTISASLLAGTFRGSPGMVSMMSSGPSVTPHRSGTFTEPSGFTYRSTQSLAPSAAACSISRSASAHAGAAMTLRIWMLLSLVRHPWPPTRTAAKRTAAEMDTAEALWVQLLIMRKITPKRIGDNRFWVLNPEP